MLSRSAGEASPDFIDEQVPGFLASLTMKAQRAIPIILLKFESQRWALETDCDSNSRISRLLLSVFGFFSKLDRGIPQTVLNQLRNSFAEGRLGGGDHALGARRKLFH